MYFRKLDVQTFLCHLKPSQSTVADPPKMGVTIGHLYFSLLLSFPQLNGATERGKIEPERCIGPTEVSYCCSDLYQNFADHEENARWVE